MSVTLPAVGSLNWGDALNTAILGLSATIDAHSVVLNSQAALAQDAGDLIGQVSTTFAPGNPNCGIAFTAPSSGKVCATVSAHMESNTNGESCYMTYEIRTGGTVGSGSVVFAAVTDYGVGVGGVANARICASRRKLITGLTPGGTFNVRTMHLCTGGSFDIFQREILIEPVKTT